MIPKIIHYCWFGGDTYPSEIQMCIDSWGKYLPDYEFVTWDENRIDINTSTWMKEAYEQKRYAFVADYVRAYALYNYGGIYLDSDVEVLKSFNDLLHLPYFFSLERFDCSNTIESGIMGVEKEHSIFKNMLEYYDSHSFCEQYNSEEFTCPQILKKSILSNFEVTKIKSVKDFDLSPKVINLLPSAYFSPKDIRINKIKITKDTYCIHHFAGTWIEKYNSTKARLHRFLGDFIYYNIIARPYFIYKDWKQRNDGFDVSY